MKLTILYRGPLASCNYSCGYCPFATRPADPRELAEDATALERLLGWCAASQHTLRLFFTPHGEALIHEHYQRAVAALSRLPGVERVAFQTNLSGALGWLERADVARLGVWATYHPGQMPRRRFLARCAALRDRGVRFSVGVVGVPEHVEEIAALRRELADSTYLWVNAAKRDPRCEDPALVRRLTAVDPLFGWNLKPHASRGKPCRTGDSVIAVDGAGAIRRCHFVPEELGNLYQPGWEAALSPRPCPAESCRCHIGYVHLVELGLDRVFGAGILERIPAGWPEEPTAA